MSLLDRHDPTKRELRWFGLLLGIFFAVVGGLVHYFSGGWLASGCIWAVGLLLTLLYYGLRSARYPLYQLWMALFAPIGLVLSYILVAAVYYGLVTPTALLMKFIRQDPLKRDLDPSTKSYWMTIATESKKDRYFQQF